MNSNSDMPFVDHLEEFRKRLIIVLVAHVIVTLLAFSQSGAILKLLMELNPQMHLIFIEPSEIMIVYVEIALVMAVTLCSPLTIYHIWAFVAAGLFPNEKRLIKVALALGFVFFVLGVVFAYKIVVPMSLKFFTRIAIDEISAMISVKSYISFILSMLLAMGIVFNIPSFVYVATKLGVITPDTLKEYSKYLIVLIFIIAAVVTPPDVVSQMMMAIPMVALLQLSIFISKKVYVEKPGDREEKTVEEKN
ncbi:MAG: twin-arginine translocase subunit TatC [Tissierellia bacterium]|nr:twin-arginine translocase subunit TatC [Tissierellia bacterium]